MIFTFYVPDNNTSSDATGKEWNFILTGESFFQQTDSFTAVRII